MYTIKIEVQGIEVGTLPLLYSDINDARREVSRRNRDPGRDRSTVYGVAAVAAAH
jgi:hypothetical protein